jgi:hypothetical protein
MNSRPRVIVLGNGFDLNLGLKTSYSNFINSDEFRSLLSTGSALAIYMAKQHELNNWIDVENELKKYSNSAYADNSKDFKKEFKELSSSLMKYLEKIDYSSINHDSVAARLIKSLKGSSTLILNFNYTQSVELLLKGYLNEIDIENCEHVQVHGSVAESNIIFGVEDLCNIIPAHVFLKKSYHKNFKAINISDLLDQSQEVWFFGYSLGETDHMYFKEFFLNLCIIKGSRKKILTHHYGDDSYHDLHIQIDALTLQKMSNLKKNTEFHLIDTGV